MNSSNLMKGGIAGSKKLYTIPELIYQDCSKIHSNAESQLIGERKFGSETYIQNNQKFGYVNNENPSEKAEGIIKNAEEKAKAIVEQALIKADKIYDEAKVSGQKTGYTDGLKMGSAAARDITDKNVEELNKLSGELKTQRDDFITTNQSQILDIALEIAKKIVGEDLNCASEKFYNMYQSAIKHVPSAKKLILTVSGADNYIAAYDTDRIKKLSDGFEYIEIRVDNSADSGTLILETSAVKIDASLNTQIDIIGSELCIRKVD